MQTLKAGVFYFALVFGTGFAPFRGGPLHFAANEQKSNVEVLRRSAAE